MSLINVQDDYLSYIKETVKRYLGGSGTVYAYGSRAKGTAKEYSDLDLAIDFSERKMPFSTLEKIIYELEESLLPFKVDVIDLNAVSSTFYNAIKDDLTKVFSWS